MKIVRGKHFSEPPVVRTSCNGSDVYGFGYTYISSLAPDLLETVTLQAGNLNPLRKLTLKHSDEIGFNYIGCNTSRMPRISEHDDLPVECVNLIDGNPESCWISKTQPVSSMTPIWIRVDFPLEKKCSRIVLRKRPLNPRRCIEHAWGPEGGAVEIGRGIPGYLVVEFSTDGCRWKKVFEGETHDSEEKEFFEIATELQSVRMVRITGTKLPMVENLMYCFSIANVEIYDGSGVNAALVTKGVGIEVNSTTHSHGQEMEVQRTLFPVHYDLGLKWVRIGYHDDVINWHWVEQKKGELKIDPYADATVTEMYDNGVETILCLNFGNRLYTEHKEREMPQLWEWNYEPPKPPKTKEALAAWERYCRFMVRHFKDRVRYFEIWNEWTNPCYWGDKPDVYLYIKIARIAIDVIREEYPEAKIVLGSYNGFLYGISRWSRAELERKRKEHPFMIAIAEFAKEVDVIGYHPFYNTDPEADEINTYDADIRRFMEFCHGEGFQGAYSVSEFSYANTTPGFEGDMWWGHFDCTEFEKAMYTARLIAIHTSYGMSSIFCETNNACHPLDLSLFRRATIQDPVDARQPQAVYYMMRNLSTYLDGVEGFESTLSVSGASRRFMQKSYIRNGEHLFALWLEGRGKESFPGEEVDLTLNGAYENLIGFDPANGVEQRLHIVTEGNKTIVKGWILKEYPVFLRGKFGESNGNRNE